MNKNACLYKGNVFHKRFQPKEHALNYKVFTLFADVDDLSDLSNKHRFFSLNKFNLMSFYEKDYGDPLDKSETCLRERLLNLLAENNFETSSIKNIKLLTYPRLFGFVFNPLTVFYCYGKNSEHLALIYEVRNTFGERHNYIYEVPQGKSFSDVHEVDKCFHVSPFFDRSGGYRFKINDPKDHASVSIDYFKENEKLMTAHFIGKKIPFNDKSIATLSLRAPFMTVKVVVGILFEALRLKIKGLRVFTHPEEHVYQSSHVTQSIELEANPQFASSNKKEK